MKSFLVFLIIVITINVPANAGEWKNKNKWKVSCGIVDKEALVVNGK